MDLAATAPPATRRCPFTGRSAAVAAPGASRALPRLPSRWAWPLPDLGGVAAMLQAPDELFRRGAALAAETGAGAFRVRVGFDEWVVVTDAAWTAAYTRLGPDDADPFEFRLRMPSLRVPGVQPPRDVAASAAVSREALARRSAPEALRRACDVMADAALRRLDAETAEGEHPDAFGLLLRCAVDMTSAALLGDAAARRLPSTLADDYRAVERALTVQDLFLPRALSPRAWSAEPARRRVAAALLEVAGRAAAEPDGVGLVHDLLAGARRRGVVGEAAVHEVAWTLNSVHWAAHRYPAVHAFWLGAELHQRPELMARLVAEQAAVPRLDADGLEAMHLLRGCVLESLRVHPLMALPRRLRRPMVVDGQEIPAGHVVALSPYLSHHDPSRLGDAERFDPERWAPEAEELPKGAFIPGGVGRWGCVGMRTTVQLLTVLWAAILRTCTWTLVDAVPAYRHGPIITPPAADLRVRVAARRGGVA